MFDDCFETMRAITSLLSFCFFNCTCKAAVYKKFLSLSVEKFYDLLYMSVEFENPFFWFFV